MTTKQESGEERHHPVHVAPGPDPVADVDDDGLRVEDPAPGPRHAAAPAHAQGVHRLAQLQDNIGANVFH